MTIEDVRPVPRLDRPAEGRVLGGVCRGLAEHLGLDVVVVRLAFVLLIVAGGTGFAAYFVFWVLLPGREQAEQLEQPEYPDEPVRSGAFAVAEERRTPGERDVSGAQGVSGEQRASGEHGMSGEHGASAKSRRARRDWLQLLTYSALTLGLSALTWASGVAQAALWPIVVCGIGAAILWQQADTDRRQRLVRSTTVPLRRMWLRSLVGVALVVAGIGGFVAQKVNAGDAREVLIATAAILSGMAVIITPWLVRLWQDLDAERRERIRSQERAEMAAHVHDSVLHTLTLIQRSATDPREVQRLARSQERELRTWLYTPQADRDETFAPAVQKIAGEVEDAHGVPLDVVCVGDCPLDERLGAALQAAREAMVNAAKYAEAPVVSVYAEVEGDEVTVFVRDRGKGFDLDGIPDDRMGVRQSIIGRMERNGGHATVRTAPGEGTEVRLRMKRS